MRILVTGGAGFLGTHVVRELGHRGYTDVHVVRKRDFDLTLPHRAVDMFEDIRPELVIHLAAHVGGIGANQKNPGTFFYDNMMMGMNVLEAARIFKTYKVVMVGTICSYPKYTPVPFQERDLWNGYPEETNAPYGIAKKALLVMSQAYRKEFGLNAVTLLPVNLYGPGDNFDPESSHVIPAMIRKFVEADPYVGLWGNGTPTREFLYVEDAARGVVDAAERYNESDPVNLGAGFEISMKDLADKIAHATGYTGRIVWDTTRPNGQPRRMLDVSLAKEKFGFEATTSFEAGLAKTITWWRSSK